jgi:hypothetical protein
MVLLDAWEQAVPQPAPARALTLLTAAWPERSAAEWASMSIGERDRNLLRLREELFGSRLEATAVCPGCAERIELNFTTRDIGAFEPALPVAVESLRVEAAGCEVIYRLPTSADILAASGAEDLLRRCVEMAHCGPITALPEEVVSAVVAGMSRADPQAEVRIAIECPWCLYQWSSLFDILSFLWGEIEDWAQRILLEVHTLASAYGWSERDIVAMSARRRRMYLDMVGA